MFAFTFHLIFVTLGQIVLKLVCILVAVAYFTLAERKVMSAVQRRHGPNVVGFWGLLQPLADGLKLMAKELIIPSQANSALFVLSPFFVFLVALLSWSVMPFSLFDHSERMAVGVAAKMLLNNAAHWPTSEVAGALIETDSFSNVVYSILFLMGLSSAGVYSIIVGGWASNSKYAFLGSLRSAAQMISYEVGLSLVALPAILLAASSNFLRVVLAQSKTAWNTYTLLPSSIIFLISMLAETNRTPFDLPEAEAELVAGYNVDFSSLIFSMFMLAEYSNMILMSTMYVLLFLGGWAFAGLQHALILTIKAGALFLFYIIVRATLPRYRYDQLMNIGWKVFLPVAGGALIFAIGIVVAFDAAPIVHELAFN